MTASTPDRASIVARMRSLYRLAFHVCGASHRAVQRSIGRDVRSMMAANDIPTLASVIDLARALGIRPAVAVDLLVSGSRERCDDRPTEHASDAGVWSSDTGSSECFEHALLIADLADDDVLLEHQLDCIPTERAALRNVVLARIFAARGSVDRSIALLRNASVQPGDEGASRSRDTALGEIALVRPDAIGALQPWIIDARHRSEPRQERCTAYLSMPERARHALETRERFHRDAVAALTLDTSRESVAIMQRMVDRLEVARKSGNNLAAAWAASITSLSALASLPRTSRDSAANARIRRIAVLAGFALDDVTRCCEPTAERLACARRARTILAERMVRATCGEDPIGLTDAADRAELRAAALRFPESDHTLQRFRHLDTFSQPRQSRLDDAVPARQIDGLSRCARRVARVHH